MGCVADNLEQAEGISKVGVAVGKKIPILLKVITKRNGKVEVEIPVVCRGMDYKKPLALN